MGIIAAPGLLRERKLISVVIPVFNEENNIARAHAEVCKVFDAIGRCSLEIIFTDNHSVDRTPDILAELARSDPRVKVVRFARNFGFQNSVLTGYRLAKGDAAFQLDCDLEDPPSSFPEFLALWEKGHDVVVGVRRHRHESKLMQLGAARLRLPDRPAPRRIGLAVGIRDPCSPPCDGRFAQCHFPRHHR
jgi:dolichol-phosphate mannosyltransferase